MDRIKKLTGKNPNEYEPIAKSLVDNSDEELFAKLVKQEDFLFDFIKANVAKRIQRACNGGNYRNILNFLKYYSPSYDTMFGEVLHTFGGEDIYPLMKNLFLNGTTDEKAYAAKYLTFRADIEDLLPVIREYAKSDFEPLSINSIELLSILKDDVSKCEAIAKLESEDDFIRYEGVKFLVTYGAKEALPRIIKAMKKSGMSESIASEVPYLVPLDELLESDSEAFGLVMCNIIAAIPEIISLSAVLDYDFTEIFERLVKAPLTSVTALVLAMAKDKFGEFASNDEYLFDCDKNTKDGIRYIDEMLSRFNMQKLKSYIYDEVYEGSDFVFFAVDYVDDVEELETLLDSENQTLVMKVLTLLKEKGVLTEDHKNKALETVTSEELTRLIGVL